MNKTLSGDVYPICIINIGEEVKELYKDYNSIPRDKYDPFTFVEWLVNVHKIKSWNTSSNRFIKYYTTAYRFNFQNPLARRSKITNKKIRIKKGKNATTTKSTK